MKNIDKIFKQLNYSDELLYAYLDLTSVKLEKKSKTLTFEFHGKTPCDPQNYFDFIKELEKFKNILPGLEEINYSVNYDDIPEAYVLKYLEGIVRYIAEKNPRFSCVNSYEKYCDYHNNRIVIIVPQDDTFMILNKNEVQKELAKNGINFEIVVKYNENDSISEQITREQITYQEEAIKKKEEEIKFVLCNPDRPLIGSLTKIKDVPYTEFDLENVKKAHGKPVYLVSGKVILVDSKVIDKSTKRYNFIISDGEDSISCQKRARTPEEIVFMDKIKPGYLVNLLGYAEYNQFVKEVTLSVTNIERSENPVQESKREDLVNEKRVELHLHTKMSAQDGVNDIADYVNLAKKFGHKAIAVTDHGSVQSFHDLYKITKPGKDGSYSIKPIYGVELTFVDENDIYITENGKDSLLSEETFVVFDIETTGLSVNFDKIIEIGAVKIKGGQVIGEFQEFINPKQAISEMTSKLTHIYNSDVQNADTEDIVLRRFARFIDGCVLVAHNAPFDLGHIKESFKRNGIEYKNYPTIDTLVLAKALYPDRDRFGLGPLAKMFKVELSQHHRAIYDAKATGEIFLHMLKALREQGIKKHCHINMMLENASVYKFPFPEHINILVKNDKGLYNLFKILSDASTNHFHKEPRLVKSVLDKSREGLLVGTGCRNSYFFQVALNKSEEELRKIITYYDYIELQPLSTFEYYKNSMTDYKFAIQSTYRKIIKLAKEYNILVVATGDVHQLNKEETVYRDVIVKSPIVGGGRHYLANEEMIPQEYFMSTDEMLEQFDFLGENLAYEIVIKNTNIIADNIDFVMAFKPDMYAPTDDFLAGIGIPSVEKKLVSMVNERANKLYGDILPGIVKDRLDKELKSILTYKYSTVYFISHLLVKKSLDDGYLVGSRGSVGSSVVATFLDITEVNPLPPHYLCPRCKFSSFKMTEEEKRKYGVRNDEIRLQTKLDAVLDGYDLDEEVCPICGSPLNRDGHDIPFETFLGFKGDKVPDIDLNFSGDYQGHVHNYIRELFGYDKAFRAGTIGTCAAKTAFGMVADYYDEINEKRQKEGLEPLRLRRAEIQRIAMQIEGSKRTSGQHPGGIVVVPNNHEIFEVTPVQYPGDSLDTSWRTTHFDYHSFEANLFKLDVLGHDDPTIIRYLMDFVKNDPLEFPFSNAKDIPLNDKKVYSLLASTDAIGVTTEEIRSEVASYGVPEFGTGFVRGMLAETRPASFSELLKISGLSHGTGVWFTNAQELVNGRIKNLPKIEFRNIIGCRDDIMVNLIAYGLPEAKAFEIMEFVRKGRAAKEKDKWAEYAEFMRGYKVPEWYIWSCGKIEYMFPKAHATAYVMMAMRIAWFKLYKPIYFYSAYFSKRAVNFDVDAFSNGLPGIINKMDAILAKGKDATDKESDLYTVLEIALEMHRRGFTFKPLDIDESLATEFKVSEDKKSLLLPFIVVDSLGESVANSIVEARKEKKFTTKEDIKKRTKLSTTLFDKLDALGAFKDLPDDNQLTLDLGFDF